MILEQNSKIKIDELETNLLSEDYYKQHPFSFNLSLNPSYNISDNILLNILTFNQDDKYKYLYQTIHEFYEEYGISHNDYDYLKNKFQNINNTVNLDNIYLDINNDIDDENNNNEIESIYSDEELLNDEIVDKIKSNHNSLSEKSLEELNKGSLKISSLKPLKQIKEPINKNSKLSENLISEIELVSENKINQFLIKNKKNKLEKLKKLILNKTHFIDEINKKKDIITFLHSIKIDSYNYDDLSDFESYEINELWELIQKIKHENKIDISYTIIKLIMFIIENIFKYIFKSDILNGLFVGLTYDIVKTELFSTHNYINNKINCPDIPFLDFISYIAIIMYNNFIKSSN